MNLPNMSDARKRTKRKVEIIRSDEVVPNDMKDFGKGKKYIIFTYGCQMNVHDSENMAAIMEEMGYTNALELEDADVVIFNTCAVRENAQNRVSGMLGRVKHVKEMKPELVTIFGGCMAQEESVANEIKDKYKWIDVVMGTHNIHKLPIYLRDALDTNKQQMEVFSIEGDIFEGMPVKRDSK